MKVTIYSIVSIVCIALAILIFIKSQSQGLGSINSIKRGELIWTKCRNSSCNAEYQIDKKDYYVQLKKEMQTKPMSRMRPPLTCKQCGKHSVDRALRCDKCGEIFFYGPISDQFPDRCPACGYSKAEAERKARVAGRNG